ncbi:DUF4367 domain-containing protein [Bacillus chungangensis]|uniref:DUF4367 domain-containing protein n=2 Tax=Bacillus chungangensis TaxID=587633 RepID=A0ABT9WQJ0_9BACI|nr:DUF4367 domain-containing protein [Bacillus chungangensis]MDQ0175369.1 hypothetical protein [Bacillus chungangensis]
MKYKVGLLVAAGMLFTTSTGLAAVDYQSLTNKQGEVVYEVKPSKKDQFSYNKEEMNRVAMSHQLAEELLQSGSAAMFYIDLHNPTKQTDIRRKHETFTDVSALRTKMADHSAKILDSVKDFKFENANVSFDPVLPKDKEAATEELRKQAEESNAGYAMMPLELSKDNWNIVSSYEKDEKRIYVNIAKSDELTTVYMPEEFDVKMEKISVKGVEMLYGESKEAKSITFIDKHNIQYHIDAQAGTLNKGDLIKLAETYLQ